MGSRDHSCEGCGRGGMNDDRPCVCGDCDYSDTWALALAARVSEFSEDERKVIDRIVSGIEKGRAVYGAMDLATEQRDLVAEADDEARDWLIYRAMQRVREAKP